MKLLSSEKEEDGKKDWTGRTSDRYVDLKILFGGGGGTQRGDLERRFPTRRANTQYLSGSVIGEGCPGAVWP